MAYNAERPSGAGRRRGPWTIALAVAAGIASVSPFLEAARGAPPAAVVELTDTLTFTPVKVRVKVGEAVLWRNGSVLVHTVTDDPALAAKAADFALPKGAKPFNSGNLKPNGTYAYTFTVPGTYRYFCIPHEAAGMIAEVIVTK